MAVDRFLGAAFASVHGPSEARSALLWTLDQGFAGLLPAPSPRPVDWRRLRREIGSLPFRFAAVRVSAPRAAAPAECGLGSSNDGEQQAAIAVVGQSVRLAMDLGCSTVVLESGAVPVRGEVATSDLGDRKAGWTRERAAELWERRAVGRDRALEGLCRGLHRLCREFPDVEFCLTPSADVLGLGEPAALAAVYEDLNRYRIGYWHDTVAAALRQEFLGEDPGRILDTSSKQLRGMTLGDPGGTDGGLPPGAGGVDYPLLSAYRQPTAGRFPVVIELDPGVDPGEIRGIHAFLDKFGL